MFFEQGRPHSAVVGGTLLRKKHLHIVTEDLKASNGRITSFKQRDGVVYKTVFWECGSVDSSTLEVWRKEQLLKVVYAYEPGNIWIKN